MDEGWKLLDYRNLTGILSRSDGLLERAEAALRRIVGAHPNDAAALLRLGDVLRSQGRLDDALRCYRRVAALRPDDPKAPWLVAVLSGEALPDAPDAGAVPFVLQADFLPPPRCRQLLALALANRERFLPLTPTISTPQGKVAAAVRTGLKLSDRIFDRVRPWFEARLRCAVAEVLRRLRMRDPGEYGVEIGMSAYLGGQLLAKHNDDKHRDRMLSFSYYFHRQPRRFSGGELLLHDPDGTAFTRMEPQHNSIVFFPPDCIHEVAAVQTGLDDFGDARFSVQGWLRPGAPAATRSQQARG